MHQRSRKAMKKKDPKAKGLPVQLQQRLNIVAMVFVLVMFTVYNFILPKGYINYEYYKYNSFKIFLFVALAAMVIISVHYRLTQPKWAMRSTSEYFSNVRNYEWALIIFLIIGLFSALTSSEPYYAIRGYHSIKNTGYRGEGFFLLLCYGITFFVVSRAYLPKKQMFYIFAISCALLALYGIGQFFDFDPLNISLSQFTSKYYIIFYATLSNTNAASALLTLCLMISGVLFIQENRDGKIWIFYICGIVILLVLCLGDTESGLVGVVGSVALLFPLIVKNQKTAMRGSFLLGSVCIVRWIYYIIYNLFVIPFRTNTKTILTITDILKNLFLWIGIIFLIVSFFLYIRRKKNLFTIPEKIWRRSWWIALLVAAIGLILLLPTFAKNTSNITIKELADVVQGEIRPEMGSKRIYVWRRALDIYEQSPVLGIGPNLFYPYFDMQFGKESVSMYGITFDATHSEYLQTLVEMGPIALVSLLAFYSIILSKAWKQSEDPMVLAVMSALICFLIQAVFNFSQPISTPIVWVIWGILGALIKAPNKT